MNKNSMLSFLKFKIHDEKVDYQVLKSFDVPDFTRMLIQYKGSEDDNIKAYLFIPKKRKLSAPSWLTISIMEKDIWGRVICWNNW